MKSQQISTEKLEEIRRTYPKGTWIRLVKMLDPYTDLKPGAIGIVDHVDDTGTIFPRWENGSCLGVVYEEDIAEKLDAEEDNYHEKFGYMSYKDRKFTGEVFNNKEFFHHLQNINFHFESGELMKLSENAVSKIKGLFHFEGYGVWIRGCDREGSQYAQMYRLLVDKYGKKFGFSNENFNEEKSE